MDFYPLLFPGSLTLCLPVTFWSLASILVLSLIVLL